MKHTLVLAALFLFAACVSPEAHRRVLGEKEDLQAQRNAMSDSLKVLAQENERLTAQVAELTSRAADAAWIDEQKKKIADILAKYGENAPSPTPGVEVIHTAEGYAFRVAGGVLFAPGRNDLTEQGKKTLTDLAGSLQGKTIRVDGHTDDTPIKNSQWGTNLRLSVERAMVVADYLVRSGGLKEESVGVAGFGATRPATPNVDDASRQANRRVEILMPTK